MLRSDLTMLILQEAHEDNTQRAFLLPHDSEPDAVSSALKLTLKLVISSAVQDASHLLAGRRNACGLDGRRI